MTISIFLRKDVKANNATSRTLPDGDEAERLAMSASRPVPRLVRASGTYFFLRVRGCSNIPASLAGTSVCGSQHVYKSIRGRKASEIKVLCIPVAERRAGA